MLLCVYVEPWNFGIIPSQTLCQEAFHAAPLTPTSSGKIYSTPGFSRVFILFDDYLNTRFWLFHLNR